MVFLCEIDNRQASYKYTLYESGTGEIYKVNCLEGRDIFNYDKDKHTGHGFKLSDIDKDKVFTIVMHEESELHTAVRFLIYSSETGNVSWISKDELVRICNVDRRKVPVNYSLSSNGKVLRRKFSARLGFTCTGGLIR